MARKRRVERFKIKERRNPGGSIGWQVDGITPTGKRIRKQYETKAEALEHKGSLELEYDGVATEYQLKRTTLEDAQLRDAEAAIPLLRNTTLADMAGHYQRLQERGGKHGLSLDAAIGFFESHYREEIETLAIATAVEYFVESRHHLAKQTQSFYRECMGLFKKLDPNTPVHRIDVRQLEVLLGKYSNVNSYRTYQRGISVFFNWCVRHHYALENPCDRLDALPADTSQVSILSLEEVKRLLRAAMLYHEGAMAAYVAIGLFAGLRPSEIQALQPQSIKEGYIVVTGGKMRRKTNRRVPIPDILKTWLEVYPFQGVPSGYSYKMKKLKEATNAERWVQDILRHTSISFQLERDQDEARTAFNNGTSRQMMERHYRDVVESPRDVEDYWQLTPESLKSIMVELPTGQGIDNWPSDQELAKLVYEKPLTHIAKDLGVSDNAVRKRCLTRDIELPKNGYWQRKVRNTN